MSELPRLDREKLDTFNKLLSSKFKDSTLSQQSIEISKLQFYSDRYDKLQSLQYYCSPGTNQIMCEMYNPLKLKKILTNIDKFRKILFELYKELWILPQSDNNQLTAIFVDTPRHIITNSQTIQELKISQLDDEYLKKNINFIKHFTKLSKILADNCIILKDIFEEGHAENYKNMLFFSVNFISKTELLNEIESKYVYAKFKRNIHDINNSDDSVTLTKVNCQISFEMEDTILKSRKVLFHDVDDIIKRWPIEMYNTNIYDVALGKIVSQSSDYIYPGNKRLISLNKTRNEFIVKNKVRIPNSTYSTSGYIYNLKRSEIDSNYGQIIINSLTVIPKYNIIKKEFILESVKYNNQIGFYDDSSQSNGNSSKNWYNLTQEDLKQFKGQSTNDILDYIDSNLSYDKKRIKNLIIIEKNGSDYFSYLNDFNPLNLFAYQNNKDDFDKILNETINYHNNLTKLLELFENKLDANKSANELLLKNLLKEIEILEKEKKELEVQFNLLCV